MGRDARAIEKDFRECRRPVSESVADYFPPGASVVMEHYHAVGVWIELLDLDLPINGLVALAV